MMNHIPTCDPPCMDAPLCRHRETPHADRDGSSLTVPAEVFDQMAADLERPAQIVEPLARLAEKVAAMYTRAPLTTAEKLHAEIRRLEFALEQATQDLVRTQDRLEKRSEALTRVVAEKEAWQAQAGKRTDTVARVAALVADPNVAFVSEHMIRRALEPEGPTDASA